MSDDMPSNPTASEPAHTDLSEALAAAVRPTPIADARHEAILQRTVLSGTFPKDASDEQEGDPLRPPTESEQRESEAFRKALEQRGDHPDVALALALAHAAGRPGPEPRLERALALGLATPPERRPRRGILLHVGFGAAATGLAMAATLLLVLRPASEPSLPDVHASTQLIYQRSLSPLFEADPGSLSASARLDRIAESRTRDLRNNRYLAWGVR